MSATFRLTFTMPGRWTSERDKALRARVASKGTSVRVSRATLAKLRVLARRVRELAPSGSYIYTPSLDELLDVMASGTLQVKSAPTPARVHAAKDPDAHANGAAAENACVADPRQLSLEGVHADYSSNVHAFPDVGDGR